MKRVRASMTISVPSDLAAQFAKLAKAEAKNKSQLFRDMFATYRQRKGKKEFFALQRYGVRQAREKGVLTEDDIEALVVRSR
jgi:metal-responsive CopG/Arc/MetJ family transcriptional regulator